MFFFSLLVLAITYNQGAARPALRYDVNSNSWNSSEEGVQNDSQDGIVFNFPTSIRKGLRVTINGSINIEDKSFTMVLLSKSSNDCKMTFDFVDKMIFISTPTTEASSTDYDAHFPPGSREAPFTLELIARLLRTSDRDAFSMIFDGNNAGGTELTCQIKSFEDIESIQIKGVTNVDSLLFEFEEDR